MIAPAFNAKTISPEIEQHVGTAMLALARSEGQMRRFPSSMPNQKSQGSYEAEVRELVGVKGMSHQAAALAIGISRGAVSNLCSTFKIRAPS